MTSTIPLPAENKKHNSYKTILPDLGLREKLPSLYAISPFQAHATDKLSNPIFVFKAGMSDTLSKRLTSYTTSNPYGIYLLNAVECPKTKLREMEQRLWVLFKKNGCVRVMTPYRTSRQEEKGEWFHGSIPQINKSFKEISTECDNLRTVNAKKRKLMFYENDSAFKIRPHLAEGFFGEYTPKQLIIK